ncbi:MAG: carboxypeptidase regulatory-like domain-containing protein [Gemmatimonadetes bacterium]|nr:carboxypeptidase regulatory-like domain-containing protein [Gemmatimonadota bacterium]
MTNPPAPPPPPPPPPPAPTATKLVFSAVPDRIVAGQVVAPSFEVQLQDASGAVITSATTAVTLAPAPGVSGVSLTGTTTVTPVNGLATFSNIIVNGAAPTFSLTASATGLSSASTPTVPLVPTPVVFDSTKSKLVSDSGQRAAGTYVFQVAANEPTPAPGAVLAGTEAGGYLRKVVSATRSGSTLTVQTAEASLTDAVQSGRFSDAVTLDLANSNISTGVSGIRWGATALQSAVPGVVYDATDGQLEFDNVVLWGDSQNGLLIKDGRLKFSPRLAFGAELKNWKLDSLEVVASGVANFDATLALTMNRSYPLFAFEKQLFTLSKPFVAFIGTWPVAGRVKLNYVLTMDADVSGAVGVNAGFTSQATIKAGARYLRGNWASLSNATAAFSPSLTANATLAASAKLGAKVEAELILYEVLGPKVWAEPFIRASRTISNNSYKDECSSAIDVGLQFNVQIFSWALAQWTYRPADPFFQTKWPQCNGSGPLVTQQLRLVIDDGNNQSGPPNAALPRSLVARVLDQNNAGVAGIPISFTVATGGGTVAPASVPTGVDGRARATWTLGGSVGNQSVSATTLSVPGTILSFVASAVRPTGDVAGTIVNAATSAPLAGADIELAQGASIIATGKSLTDGTFRITGVPTGIYTLTARAAGFTSASVPNVDVKIATNSVGTIRLQPVQQAGNLGGTVTNSYAAPVGGAIVELRLGAGVVSGTPIATDTTVATATPTRQAGEYRFNAISAGTYTLLVRRTGFPNKTESPVQVVASTSNVRNVQLTSTTSSVTVAPTSLSLAVGASATLTATARDAIGSAMSGRTVTWRSSSPSVASVSSSGVVLGLAAGQASITATVDGISGSAQLGVVNSCAAGTECEPNNTVATATPLASGQTLTAALSAAGDRDYFQLGLGGASNLTVSLSLPVALTGPGRVNISLLDANGRVLTYGCTAANGTTASLTFTNVPQTAYVMVGSESYTGTSCNYLSNSSLTVGAYSISLTATQIGGAGLDPIFEPNNTIATATPLASGQTLTAALSAAGDRDYFQLGLSGASNLTVSLSLPVALTGPGRVNISLLDANGRILTYGCTAANGTTASLTFTNVPQTAYVMVGSESYTGTSCSYLSNSNLTVGAYSISLTATQIGGAGLDPIFEPNNTIATATPLASGQTLTAALSAAGDRDYFQLGLGGASNLTVSLSLPVALTGPGRVNISLLDANGRVLTYGCTAANGTTASLTFTNVPQTAYVMVGSESYTGTSCSYLSNSNLTVGAYSISLTATQIGGAGLDPIFEPNNTIATATPLASGQTLTAALSAAGDRDYFQLGLGGASNLTLSLSLPVALTGPGRVNISLLDANGRILTYGCTAANGTTASLTFTNVPQPAYVMVGSESYTGTSCSYLSNSNLTVGAYSLSLR